MSHRALFLSVYVPTFLLAFGQGMTVPTLPLYQRPTPLIYKSDLLGMVNNPGTVGPVWNIQDWHWK